MSRDRAVQPGARRRLAIGTEATAVWLLAAAVVIAPLAIACAPEWPRAGLEVVMALVAFLWAVSGPRSPVLIGIPVVVSLLFCLQVVPLPDSILFAIAPISGGAWKAQAAVPPSAWGSISIDPAATLAAIRRLFLGLAMAGAVTSLARSKAHRTVLIWSLAVTGVVLAVGGTVYGPTKEPTLLGGTVDLSGIFRKTYDPSCPPVMSAGFGLREIVRVGDQQYTSIAAATASGFFTYPYCNLLAGALAATLPVGMGLWLAFTAGRLPAWLRWGAFGLAAGGSMWLAAVRAGSRGGGVALAVAWICLAVIVSREHWKERGLNVIIGRIAAGGLVVLGVALVLLWAGVLPPLPAAWRDKILTELQSGRLGAAIIAFRMFRASPIMGTGFDTYQLLMPRYATERFIVFYAHNDYAQLLAEAGLLGMAFLGITAVMLAGRFLRFWNEARGPYRVTNAGPWASFVGLAVHSAFDWNCHLPANALLGCVLFGLVASSVPEPRPAWRDESRWTAARVVAAVVLVLGCVWVAPLLVRDALVEHQRRHVMRAVSRDSAYTRWGKLGHAEGSLREALPGAVAIAPWAPGNARLALAIGQGYLHLAAQPGARGERPDLITAAEAWLTRARQRGPALQGVPQPVRP
jgi:hypothetical protein